MADTSVADMVHGSAPAGEQQKMKSYMRSRFFQQKLPHVYARYSLLPYMFCIITIAAMLFALGFAVVSYSASIDSIIVRYDNVSNYTFTVVEGSSGAHPFEFDGMNYSMGVVTRVPFRLMRSLSAPIYMSYFLSDFYQNNRLYAQSLDMVQLMGKKSALLDTCDPFRYPGDSVGKRVAGYYSPCGAIAWSMFNDSIKLYRGNGSLICDGAAFDGTSVSTLTTNMCSKKGIALRSDARARFKVSPGSRESGPMWSHAGATSDNPYLTHGYYQGEAGHRIPLPTDEDFIIWTNIAFMPSFEKLYRIIEEDLPAGEYYFEIVELYDTYSVGAQKFVQLSTRSWIGEKSQIIGFVLLSIGSISFVLVLLAALFRLATSRAYIKGIADISM